ncbi:MAG: ATP-binding protein [Vicinamibacterales bacterium]
MSLRPVRSVIVNVLTHDTLVLLYLAVVATEALLYSLPLLDPGTLTAFGASPFQIPFVTTAAMAGFYGLGRIQDAEERIFWRNLAYACVFWVATLVAIALVPAGEWRPVDEMWVDAAYLFFYSPILFAAECKPHLTDLGPRRDVERQLRWAGVTILVSGWFLYFVVAPAAADTAWFGTMLPSALLFVTVDAAIVIRFAWRASSSGSTRWRVLYGTITLAGASLLLTDTLDALEGLGYYALPDGAKTDLLWAVPPFFLLLAFRLREADLPRTVDAATGERAASSGLDPVRVGSFLVASAFSFPLVHFALHAWLPLSARLVVYQRLIVLGELLVLGALAVAAFLYLERQRVAAGRRRTALEDRLQRARALEAVSRVAAVVADNYRTTLKSISTFVDRAIDGLGPGDPLRDDAARAAEHVQRAMEFAHGLRAISRQHRGRPAQVDLGAAISDLSPELRHALGPKVLLESVPAREPCVILIDPTHLRVVLLDLATNARDAMPDGGRCRVETSLVDLDPDAAMELAVQPGRYARLIVRDSGSGIPNDVLPHLFEPFFSTKGSAGGSTGLGLATLYALVSQYGGCVTVTSEPGDTAFELLLPSPL